MSDTVKVVLIICAGFCFGHSLTRLARMRREHQYLNCLMMADYSARAEFCKELLK